MKFVVLPRVSTPKQSKGGENAQQFILLSRFLIKHETVVVASLPHVGPGYDNDDWLKKAAKLAKKLGARLVAETPCRLVRNEASSKSWATLDSPPTKADLERVKKALGGLRPMTFIPPSADSGEMRAHQKKRGQFFKGAGGNYRLCYVGSRKRRIEDRKPLAVELRNEGFSLGLISSAMGVPKSTVARWCVDCSPSKTMTTGVPARVEPDGKMKKAKRTLCCVET